MPETRDDVGIGAQKWRYAAFRYLSISPLSLSVLRTLHIGVNRLLLEEANYIPRDLG